MSPKFEELLISQKREQFVNAVIRACQEIGAIPSYVNFDGCNFSRDENSHIHIEQNIICVSENYLKRATHEDLKSTAYHEVAHLINGTHDCGFTKLCNSLKTTLWEPPIGLQRKYLDDFEREQLYNYMEEDLRKWKRIEIDENGEEYFLKGRTLFKRYLKDEITSYKPRCILTRLPKIDVSNLPRSAPEINTHEEKRKEILQRKERKEHLIRLTEAMSGTPISDGV